MADTDTRPDLGDELIARFGPELRGETLALLREARLDIETLCDEHHETLAYLASFLPQTPEGRRCVAVALASHLLIHDLLTPRSVPNVRRSAEA